MTLAGKSALVTGGSRGIGRAVARSLALAGAQVMICARSSAEVAREAQILCKLGAGRVEAAVCDVGDERMVRDLLARTIGVFGALDILVNNAGIGLLGPVATFSPDRWRATINTNLSGAFYCCHHAIPAMKVRGGGHIINMASRSSVNAYAGGAAYCASKFGLLGFSEALNLELRPDNIRVSCVMPGRVATDFAGEAPQDWHLTVEDVAEAVLAVLAFNPRALASRIELRPARPAQP